MPRPLDYKTPPTTNPPRGFRLNSRAVLLAAGILLTLCGVMFYAGPAWELVLVRLLMDGGITLFWLASFTGIGTFLLRRAKLWELQSPGALRWATASAVGLGVISLLTLMLGLAGALNGVVAWAVLAVGLVLGAISVRNSLSRNTLLTWLTQPADWSWLWLLASPFMILALTAAMAPPLMLWTPQEPHGYDVVEYHLQIPREWYEAHRIIPLHHNVFSFFPFNVEMHYLLAMHLHGGPWAGMYLAQLMHLAFFALLVLAVYGLARRFANPPSAIIAALFLLTVPWLTQLSAIAYDEGGFLLFGILSIGWALSATFELNDRSRRFALAGAMAGFAAGSKLTAVPEVLVAVPVIAALAGVFTFVIHRKAEDFSRLLRGVFLFGVMGTAAFSPWLIRNIVWAHNPVFPELMPVLGHGDFTPVQVERFEKAHKPPHDQQKFSRRVRAFCREVLGLNFPDAKPTYTPSTWQWERIIPGISLSAWQFGYIILPMTLIAFALSIRQPRAWCLLGLLLLLTGFWLSMTHLQSRFFILAAPIAALMIAGINWRRGAFVGVLLVVVFGAIGWLQINSRLIAKLYGSTDNPNGIVSVLAMDGATLYPQLTAVELPATGTIFLVGDARAFLYPTPMSRLRYRTVFDVKDASDIVKAWLDDESPAHGDSVIIDPAELKRFHQTYFGLPPLPREVEQSNSQYIVKR